MAYSNAVDAQSPTSHWPLGEASGNAIDRKGVHDLSPSAGGLIRAVAGLVQNNGGDGATAFNGSTGYLQAGASTTYDTTTFTMSATISPTTGNTGVQQTIIDNAGAYPDQHSGLSVDTNGTLTAYFQASTAFYQIVSGATVLQDGVTYRVTCSYDGTTFRLFLNGVLDGSFSPAGGNATPKTTNAAHALYVGKANDSTRFFGGTIDEVQVFPAALTEAQDLAIYQAGFGSEEPGPSGWRSRGPGLRQPGAGPRGFVERRLAEEITLVTSVSDSDTGTGTEGTTDVQATVPGADSGAGSDTGVVAETGAGGEAGAGTDSGTVSVTASGSDTATGTDAGTSSTTAPGSDTGTGTDTGSASVTVSSSDTAAGTDTGQVAVPLSGSDTATGTESQIVAETGAGGEAGAGTETGAIAVTASGADSGTGTDAGSVADITVGPTIVTGSDSGTGSESAFVTDITVVEPPPDEDVDEGGGVYTPPSVTAVSDFDVGFARETAKVVDLTPRPRLRLRRPLPSVERAVRERALDAAEAGHATEAARALVAVQGEDRGVGVESARVDDLTARVQQGLDEEREMWQILALADVL